MRVSIELCECSRLQLHCACCAVECDTTKAVEHDDGVAVGCAEESDRATHHLFVSAAIVQLIAIALTFGSASAYDESHASVLRDTMVDAVEHVSNCNSESSAHDTHHNHASINLVASASASSALHRWTERKPDVLHRSIAIDGQIEQRAARSGTTNVFNNPVKHSPDCKHANSKHQTNACCTEKLLSLFKTATFHSFSI